MSDGLKATYLSANDNRFVVIDFRQQNEASAYHSFFGDIPKNLLVRKLTNGEMGLFADGVVFLTNPQRGGTLAWDFYNCDGSNANFCGNAARCVGHFIFHNDPAKNDCILEIGTGLIRIYKNDQKNIVVEIPEARLIDPKKKFYFQGNVIYAALVDSGVPHLVLKQSEEIDLINLRRLAQFLRKHPDLGQAGANVTFYHPLSEYKVEAITFERGVEAFTRACGTGAIAAVADFKKQTSDKTPVEVVMPGGSIVISHGDNNSLHLSGEVHFHFGLDFSVFPK